MGKSRDGSIFKRLDLNSYTIKYNVLIVVKQLALIFFMYKWFKLQICSYT